MINFELGEQITSGQRVELPIAVTLNALPEGNASLPANITFTFTLPNQVSEVRVTYRYEDPALLRVVEGGQTFEVKGSQ